MPFCSGSGTESISSQTIEKKCHKQRIKVRKVTSPFSVFKGESLNQLNKHPYRYIPISFSEGLVLPSEKSSRTPFRSVSSVATTCVTKEESLPECDEGKAKSEKYVGHSKEETDNEAQCNNAEAKSAVTGEREKENEGRNNSEEILTELHQICELGCNQFDKRSVEIIDTKTGNKNFKIVKGNSVNKEADEIVKDISKDYLESDAEINFKGSNLESKNGSDNADEKYSEENEAEVLDEDNDSLDSARRKPKSCEAEIENSNYDIASQSMTEEEMLNSNTDKMEESISMKDMKEKTNFSKSEEIRCNEDIESGLRSSKDDMEYEETDGNSNLSKSLVERDSEVNIGVDIDEMEKDSSEEIGHTDAEELGTECDENIMVVDSAEKYGTSKSLNTEGREVNSGCVQKEVKIGTEILETKKDGETGMIKNDMLEMEITKDIKIEMEMKNHEEVEKAGGQLLHPQYEDVNSTRKTFSLNCIEDKRNGLGTKNGNYNALQGSFPVTERNRSKILANKDSNRFIVNYDTLGIIKSDDQICNQTKSEVSNKMFNENNEIKEEIQEESLSDNDQPFISSLSSKINITSGENCDLKDVNGISIKSDSPSELDQPSPCYKKTAPQEYSVGHLSSGSISLTSLQNKPKQNGSDISTNLLIRGNIDSDFAASHISEKAYYMHGIGNSDTRNSDKWPNVLKTTNKLRQRKHISVRQTNANDKSLHHVKKGCANNPTALNFNQLTSVQVSNLKLQLEKQGIIYDEYGKSSSQNQLSFQESLPVSDTNLSSFSISHSDFSDEGETTPNRLSTDTDDALPIQAEVIMSEDSDSGSAIGSTEEDIVNRNIQQFLTSFVKCSSSGSVIEVPPKNNSPPKNVSDLTQWQLNRVSLPKFTPFLEPPLWLRLTIPADGYSCLSCGDIFFVESSLVQHRERRSIWISLECGPCEAKLIFYNRCALKDHIRKHELRNEQVDEENVIVRSLPLQLTRLLQPITVPVPDSLRPSEENEGSRNEMEADCSDSSESLKNNCSVETATIKTDHPRYKKRNGKDLRHPMPACSPSLSPSKRPVQCYLCDRIFSGVRELMSHMRTDQTYSDQRVECRKCLLVLPSVCAAKAHILTHPPANSSNISVCPECGSRCDGPRDFVHHLNTCGHQFRRSGILCVQCQVCFFKFTDDFINHWIKEHCSKSYECLVCSNSFDALVFHECSSGQQVLATFRCLLTCPLCPHIFRLHTHEEKETLEQIRNHLTDAHSHIVNRIYYVYKSKFCTNAFRSKDELRAHHDREHRRDNQYHTKTCSLNHEVLGYQHQYFSGQEPLSAFVTLHVTLSAEELQEAETRDVPTVSSVVDKTLFPSMPVLSKNAKNARLSKAAHVDPEDLHNFSVVNKEEVPSESLIPCFCYKCGYTYTGVKDLRKHKMMCNEEHVERLCQSCGFSAVGEEFSRHCLTHIQDGLIICIYCNGSPFSSHKDLQQHFEHHIHEQFRYPVVCPFCSFLIKNVYSALAHLKEEHDPLRQTKAVDYLCERCGRKFHGVRGLRVHLTRCASRSSISASVPSVEKQCQVCKKVLNAEIYGKHIGAHLEEGLLICGLCDGLALPSSMALLHHLEEHAQNLSYPWLCPVCVIKLENQSDTLQHLKGDHGFGNLICLVCEMTYTYSYQLQKHIDIVHKVCLYTKRRYICWICRAYDNSKKETLMNHFRVIHELSAEEVDEKIMIRTRGLGTVPTSHFIPIKPLGCKEQTSSLNKACKQNMEKLRSAKSSAVSKDSSRKTDSHPVPSRAKDSMQDDAVDVKVNITRKQLFRIVPICKEETTAAGDEVVLAENTDKTSRHKIMAQKLVHRISRTHHDRKLKSSTKVLLQRLPESAVVMNRKRKIAALIPGPHSEGKTRKMKRQKAFQCQACRYGTNCSEKFDFHSKKHSLEIDGFICSICGETFVVDNSLKRHMFFAHKVKLQIPAPSAKIQVLHEETLSEQPVQRIIISKHTSPRMLDKKIINVNSLSINYDGNLKQNATSGEKSELQCCVCKEEFSASINLYSHLRTHGMAFLKIGREKRSFLSNSSNISKETEFI